MRTQVQVDCLKMFYQAMLELHNEYRTTPLARFLRKPMFRIALLFVSEEVSVQRQLKRGLEIQAHNRQVRETGIGKLLEERPTDIDPELCRNVAIRLSSDDDLSRPCNRCGRFFISTSSTRRGTCRRCRAISCMNSPIRARWS